MSNQLLVSLSISADEFIRLYQGTAKVVNTLSEDGRRVQFPASILQRYVTRSGIAGRFMIEFDENNRFSSIHKIS